VVRVKEKAERRLNLYVEPMERRLLQKRPAHRIANTLRPFRIEEKAYSLRRWPKWRNERSARDKTRTTLPGNPSRDWGAKAVKNEDVEWFWEAGLADVVKVRDWRIHADVSRRFWLYRRIFYESAMKWITGIKVKGAVVFKGAGIRTRGFVPSNSVVLVGVASQVHSFSLALARGVPGSH
jgi:hypothetical protein